MLYLSKISCGFRQAKNHSLSVNAIFCSPAISKLIFVQTVLLPPLSKIGTPKFRRFVVKLIPWKAVQDFIEIVDTMHNTSVEIFESKKQALAGGDDALERQIARGKDLMSILCEL